MTETHQFVRVDFHRFKAFETFVFQLHHFNILVGPNNAGKSTILAAFRILAAAIRKATSRKPERVNGPHGNTYGYKIDLSSVSVAEENIFYNYDDSEPAIITFKLSNNNKMILYFPEQGILTAEMAQAIGGKPDLSKASQIELEKLARDQRLQRVIFQTASNIYDQMHVHWKGNREFLLAQVIGIVEQFIQSDCITISPPLFETDPLRRRLIITLNMNEAVQHIWSAIKETNQESVDPVFDKDHPIRGTGDMHTWYTGRPCDPAQRSHINFCVHDSAWESTDSYELDRNKHVEAWVKNDHLGFEIFYIYQGVMKKYRPDYLIRLANGHHLILEAKGQDSPVVQAKKKAAEEWVRAVSAHRGFGIWHYAISFNPKDVTGILSKYAQAQAHALESV